jgi:hypothetical protein
MNADEFVLQREMCNHNNNRIARCPPGAIGNRSIPE